MPKAGPGYDEEVKNGKSGKHARLQGVHPCLS